MNVLERDLETVIDLIDLMHYLIVNNPRVYSQLNEEKKNLITQLHSNTSSYKNEKNIVYSSY